MCAMYGVGLSAISALVCVCVRERVCVCVCVCLCVCVCVWFAERHCMDMSTVLTPARAVTPPFRAREHASICQDFQGVEESGCQGVRVALASRCMLPWF